MNKLRINVKSLPKREMRMKVDLLKSFLFLFIVNKLWWMTITRCCWSLWLYNRNKPQSQGVALLKDLFMICLELLALIHSSTHEPQSEGKQDKT